MDEQKLEAIGKIHQFIENTPEGEISGSLSRMIEEIVRLDKAINEIDGMIEDLLSKLKQEVTEQEREDVV